MVPRQERLQQTLILRASWVALGLYLLASLVLLAWRALRCGEAEALFLRGPGLRASLLWGGGLGAMPLVVGLRAAAGSCEAASVRPCSELVLTPPRPSGASLQTSCWLGSDPPQGA